MPAHISLLLLSLAIPTTYLAGAAALRLLRPNQQIRSGLVNAVAAVTFAIAVILAAIVAFYGAMTLTFARFGGAAPSFRLDTISLSILLLVTFVGFIVVRFSRNYLDGDPRQDIFFARLCITLTATTVLALAGDLVLFTLGWVALSLALHGLLVFYRDRHLAMLAARKKFIIARLGDLCLIVAFTTLWVWAGTTEITAIDTAAVAGELADSGT